MAVPSEILFSSRIFFIQIISKEIKAIFCNIYSIGYHFFRLKQLYFYGE